MELTIKFLKDYKDFKAGETGLVSKEAADQLVVAGIAEITVADVDVKTEKKAMEDSIEKAVSAAVAKGLEAIPAIKVEVKEKPIYNTLGEFMLDIRKSASDGGLTTNMNRYANFMQEKAPDGNNTLINTEGGYLIPQEFSTSLMEQVNIESKIFNRTRSIPINNNIVLPYINTSDMSGTSVGGVDIAWGNEGGTLSASKAEFKTVELKLKKMHAFVYATDELLSDSATAIESVMTQLAGAAIAREKDQVVVSGSGVGRPLGFLNAPALVTITRDTGSKFLVEDITAMWERISNPGGAVWLINRSVLPQLYTMVQEVGTTGGASIFMFNVAERQGETILGAPIIWTDLVPALASAGAVNLVDLSQYLTATKAGGPDIKSASSIHVKFLTDQVAFRFTTRLDGQPWWPAPQTPKNGNTISPFVTLSA